MTISAKSLNFVNFSGLCNIKTIQNSLLCALTNEKLYLKWFRLLFSSICTLEQEKTALNDNEKGALYNLSTLAYQLNSQCFEENIPAKDAKKEIMVVEGCCDIKRAGS